MSSGWPPADGTAVCIGETMAALAPTPPQALDLVDDLRLSVAGAESNVAMYLADLGRPVSWLSALGDDAFGRRVRAAVAAAGVDVTGVRTDPGRPTGLLVKDPGPERTRVHYYRTGSAASALGPDVLDDPRLRSAALLHLTGITPALSPSCRDLVRRALDTPSDSRPYAISFDVNHRPALWPDDGTAATVLRELADRADIVFVGLDEAQELWGADLEPDGVRRLLAPRAWAWAWLSARFRLCPRMLSSPSVRAMPSPPGFWPVCCAATTCGAPCGSGTSRPRPRSK